MLTNAVLNREEIPESWRGTIIVRIHKKGAKDIPANYRPISLIDDTEKMFCRQVLIHLQDWMDEHKVLSHLKAVFCVNIGIIDQIFCFMNICWKYIYYWEGSSECSLYGHEGCIWSNTETYPLGSTWQDGVAPGPSSFISQPTYRHVFPSEVEWPRWSILPDSFRAGSVALICFDSHALFVAHEWSGGSIE